MAKPQKIKRHQKINWSGRGRNRRATLPETALVVVLLAVVAGLGWLLYTPVYNFIMGLTLEPPNSLPSLRALRKPRNPCPRNPSRKRGAPPSQRKTIPQ